MRSLTRTPMKLIVLGLVSVVFLMLIFCYSSSYRIENFFNWASEQENNFEGITYIHPHDNLTRAEKKFQNNESAQLTMKLMDQLEKGKVIKEYTLESLSKAMTPVTAISSNHYNELVKHIDVVHQFMPNKKLIVYDLGLSRAEQLSLKKKSFVEYREFDFTGYPNHVKNLKKYAWKILIIQQVLAERGGVFWMDSSVLIEQNYTEVLQQMVKKKFGFLYYLSLNGHSIVAATQPGMFKYLPMKSPNDSQLNMPQASGMLVFNTLEVRQHIMKWAILCCLLENCIAPKGSTRYCDFNFPKDKFGGCHRYDQSMMSIIVVNAANARNEQYTLTNLSFATMERIR